MSADRYFKILVVNPEMVQNPSLLEMTLEPGILTTITNYLPPPQFIKGSDLGITRAENNQTFFVDAFDPYPLLGSTKYQVIEGATIYDRLPDFLKLDFDKGIIYGYIPYQPAYDLKYNVTVQAIKTSNTTTVTAINTYTLTVQGEVDSTIEWVSSSSLGIIYSGYTSELALNAKQINSEYSIKYFLLSGNLPQGLSLQSDGSISGRVNYGQIGTYTFTARAQDVYELSSVDKQFSLTVKNYNDTQYTRIWVRPFMSLDQRSAFRDFTSDAFTFPPSSMYRLNDSNFGIQSEIKMILEFGIQKQNLAEYIPALRENFYRRRFYFGNVKLAIARDQIGNIIYEIIYLDVIDNLERNNDGEMLSVSNVVYSGNNTYYPASVQNMKRQLQRLSLNSTQIISTDEFQMPLFMRTPQQDEYRPAGYMHIIPLCYVLPGEGSKIISRIKLKNFDFKQFDMDIDRLIISETLDNSTDKYILFPRKSITDKLDSDQVIFVFDESPLQTNTNDSITRE